MFTESRLFFECQKCPSFFSSFLSFDGLFDVLMSAQAYPHKHQTKDLRLLFPFFPPSYEYIYLRICVCFGMELVAPLGMEGKKRDLRSAVYFAASFCLRGEREKIIWDTRKEVPASERQIILFFARFFHAPLAVKWFFYVGKNWELTTVLANFFLRSIRRRSGGGCVATCNIIVPRVLSVSLSSRLRV